MGFHAGKTRENKSQSIADAVAQKKGENKGSHLLPDNRPETIAQKRMQGEISQASRVRQFRAYQQMANRYTSQLAPSQVVFYHNQPVIQAMFGRPTNGPIPDRLEYGASTMATTCAMVLLEGNLTLVAERTFVSGGGLHAEEKVIQYLQAKVDDGTLTPQGAGTKDYILFLNVSKSPCSSTSVPQTRTDGNLGCLEHLTALNANGLVSAATGATVTFDVQLAATKPYQGKVAGGKQASRDSYDGFGGGADGGGAFEFVR